MIAKPACVTFMTTSRAWRYLRPINRLLPSLTLTFALIAPLHAQDDAEAYIARIERPQVPGTNELDSLDLPALMQRLHVPGFSIAV